MLSAAPSRLLIVGNPDPVHVGSHLHHAATSLGLDARLCDSREAYAAPAWRQKTDWWVRGHRPSRLGEFSARVLQMVRSFSPDVLITTGLAPVDAPTLKTIGDLGTARLNFLTDDPWNPAHRAPWFFEALKRYDRVFTPRRATVGDLEAHGVPAVSALPFAYAPEQHYPEPPAAADASRWDADVMIAGGADRDRIEVVAPLIRAGFRVALYGGYWDRFRETREMARGQLDASGLRQATAAARVCLGLVRRANRDGHCMRTYEVPAMGGCFLAEDTADHRALFGRDGEAAVYFVRPADAVDKVAALMRRDDLRRDLARRAHAIVTAGGQTYADRLQSMLSTLVPSDSPQLPPSLVERRRAGTSASR
ncbi:MAG TPA: glycosyltransferase [Vicinamibacterales bacterium]|nr:glycosyltransferase [Vicinamibacterales bacterium]